MKYRCTGVKMFALSMLVRFRPLSDEFLHTAHIETIKGGDIWKRIPVLYGWWTNKRKL